MSLLTDHDIELARKAACIQVTPWNPQHLGPASLDVTLSDLFRVPTVGVDMIDLEQVPEGHTTLVQQNRMTIAPGQFLLASTVEHLSLSKSYACRYEGRSSLGRLGLASHITAGFIDPGFHGTITLEIANHAPWSLVLHAGMRIGQLCFFKTMRPAEVGYGLVGHYQDQRGPVESRFRL